MKAKRMWIVVADGARARLLVREGTTFVQLSDGVYEGDRTTAHEVGADRPGRSYESAGTMRHGIEPKTSHRELVEAAFLDRIVARLEAERQSGALERLVLIAAPAALGYLRKAISPALAALVVGEIHKDLTHAPLEAVIEAVGHAVPL